MSMRIWFHLAFFIGLVTGYLRFVMPQRIKRPCSSCRAITRNASGYCDKCEPKQKSNWEKYNKYRGSRHQRGYGTEWTNRIRPAAIERNRKKYIALYLQHPSDFRIESFPNMEGEPLQGFCEESFAEGVIRIGTHVDHKKNKASGGTDAQSNLQVLSAMKHRTKTGREGAQGGRVGL